MARHAGIGGLVAVMMLSQYCLLTCPLAVAAFQVQGVEVHKVPLRRVSATAADKNNTDMDSDGIPSPFCFAASSIIDLTPDVNFLATQVWPSARVAALALERYVHRDWTVCEFGCGPGLPSITAASLGCPRVMATDIDRFALDLVGAAAKEQDLASSIETFHVDLLQCNLVDDENKHGNSSELSWFPWVDLFIFSDVFESAEVARGAASVTAQILDLGAKVWVFAQTDRAQREIYLQCLQKCLDDSSLDWTSFDDGPANFRSKTDGEAKQDSLWLCDVDETAVLYG